MLNDGTMAEEKGAGLKDSPRWFFAAIGTAVQSFSALLQIQEPLRIFVFGAVVLTSTIVVMRVYSRPPTWFMAGILVALALFTAMSPSGREWWASFAGSINNPAPKVASAPRFVSVGLFLDEDRDGVRGRGEQPLPGVPVVIRDYDGNTNSLANQTGATTAHPVRAPGAVTVMVCGISQTHEIPEGHASPDIALSIDVGVTSQARTACNPRPT